MKKLCKECGEIKEMFSWENTCYSCSKKLELERIQADVKEAQTTGDDPDTMSGEYVVCPYCGYAHETCLGYEDFPEIYEEGSHKIECDECGKEFELETMVSRSWETRKAEEKC